MDESASKTDSVDWDALMEEEEDTAVKEKTASKRKAPTTPTKAKTAPSAAQKGKAPMQPISLQRKSVPRKKARARGIEIRESVAHEQSTSGEGFENDM